MPVTREKKEAALTSLKEEFGGRGSAIFTDFRGVDVAGITDLRAKLRAQGARYLVAKRTVIEKALPANEQIGVMVELDKLGNGNVVKTLLEGSTGICFADAEPIAVAKVLVDFRKDYEKFGIKGAFLAGRFYSAAAVAALATTPPREVLLARLLGAMNGPASGFAGVLAAVIRQFLGTLQAIADEKAKAAQPAS